MNCSKGYIAAKRGDGGISKIKETRTNNKQCTNKRTTKNEHGDKRNKNETKDTTITFLCILVW
jgi:hypothetical protein